MYPAIKPPKTSIRLNQSTPGEPIEAKVRRIESQDEPIADGAPLIYQTEREGVPPQYDIRTDSRDLAAEAMDNATRQFWAKREAAAVPKTDEKTAPGGTEPGNPE